MADHGVGSAGLLTIADDGTTVRFYVSCSDPATNTGAYSWFGTVNGSPVGGTIALGAGFGTRLLGSWAVSASQTVTLGQDATGTSGLGGSASFSEWISRVSATVPDPPRVTGSSAGLDQITSTGMRFRYRMTGDGGSTITDYQYQVSTRADFAGASWVNGTSSGDIIRNDLDPGTTYYWRARAKNAIGWSAPSDVVSAATIGGGRLRVAGVWKNTARWMRVAGVWKRTTRWVKVSGVWKRAR